MIHVAQNQQTYIIRLIFDERPVSFIEMFLHAVTGGNWKVVVQTDLPDTVHGLAIESVAAILAARLLQVQPTIGSGYDALSAELIQEGLVSSIDLLNNMVTHYLGTRP